MNHLKFSQMAQISFKLFLSIFTLVKFSSAVDTLFHNQTITFGQTLVSENQVFELGFFHPQNSRNEFMGIWYKATPDNVVWVANRDNPITHYHGVVFSINKNGSLAITRNGSSIWSWSNPSAVASPPFVRLLDTGNLVVVGYTSQDYLWQSFDYPTDTWLPGLRMADDADAGVERYLTSWRNTDDPSPGDFVMRIENVGLSEVVIFRGTQKWFRTGKLNGLYFGGIPRSPIAVSEVELTLREEKVIYMWRPYDTSIITRTVLDTSGSVHRYSMNARKDKWNIVDTFPQDQCDVYAHCGPNAMCSIEKEIKCQCFKGFTPKFKNDWELQDWSGGCKRIVALDSDCEGGDGFVEVRGVKYPDMLRFWLNTSMSLDECRAECLNNCSCTAYANPFVTNGGSGCIMWFGDLLDTRGLSAADRMQNIYIRVPVSELDFSTDVVKDDKKWNIKLILISLATGVLISSLINGGLFLLTRRKRPARDKDEVIDFPTIEMAALVEATNNFSKENMLGSGGFGSVYKGKLSTGQEIAVKRLSRSSEQGVEEFKNEVRFIAKLQHRNLVRLLGCCTEEREMMLIYEFLQNKSLDYVLFDENQRKLLTWPKRFDIIMGISRGLLYLHHDSRLKIIHRDLKPSNILLDEDLNPKISDFGIARTFKEDKSFVRTRRVVGTHGYMSPEYAIEGKFSVKSDIFSLGVVLLEIISGKKNRRFEHKCHHHSLLGHAWLLWRENKMLELVDECLNDTLIESQVKRCMHVGLLCVQKLAEDRPTMSLVSLMLATDGAILPDPKEPGFFMETSFGLVPDPDPSPIESEQVTITITDLEAR